MLYKKIEPRLGRNKVFGDFQIQIRSLSGYSKTISVVTYQLEVYAKAAIRLPSTAITAVDVMFVCAASRILSLVPVKT